MYFLDGAPPISKIYFESSYFFLIKSYITTVIIFLKAFCPKKRQFKKWISNCILKSDLGDCVFHLKRFPTKTLGGP